MKFANKLMVVPFVPRLENATESQIFSIDHDMKKILLDDKVKNNDDKVKLYYNALSKYRDTLDRYQLSKDMTKSSYADSFSSQVASKMMEQIEENFVFPKKTKKEKSEPTENTPTLTKAEPIEETPTEPMDEDPALKEEKEDTNFEESFSANTGLDLIDNQDEQDQTQVLDANVVDNGDDQDDEEHLDGVSTNVSIEKQGNATQYEFARTRRLDEKIDQLIPQIFTSETSKTNGKEYIIFRGTNSNFMKKLESTFQDGVDVEKTINFMKESGYNSLENELAKIKRFSRKLVDGKTVSSKKKDTDIKREITKETNKFLLLNCIDKSIGRVIRKSNLNKTSKVILKKSNKANLVDRKNEDILLNEGKLSMHYDDQIDNQKASGLTKNWIFKKFF